MATRSGIVTVEENGRRVRLWRVRTSDLWEVCGRCSDILSEDDTFTRGPGELQGHQAPNAPVCASCRPWKIEQI